MRPRGAGATAGAHAEAAGMLPPARFFAVVRDAPLVSFDVVVRDRAGRVLLGLRRNEPARGCWFVPGGSIRKHERLDDAFRRICAAELGIARERADSRLLGVHEHHYDANFAGEPGVGTHYVVLAHEIVLDDSEQPVADDQHDEHRWFGVAELLAAGDVHEHVKAYFRSATPGL